tara:strand:+ start:1191 stop:1610 length:420 start_codon:yes stop_codon:yes gene_type:complete
VRPNKGSVIFPLLGIHVSDPPLVGKRKERGTKFIMPWKTEKQVIRDTIHDRVRTLSPSQRKEIKELYTNGQLNGVQLADMFEVSTATIYRIIHPEKYKKYGKNRYEKNKEQILKDHKTEEYKTHRRFMRHDLNQYKKSL